MNQVVEAMMASETNRRGRPIVKKPTPKKKKCPKAKKPPKKFKGRTKPA